MDRVDYQSIVIQDLVNMEKAGELQLNPWYQRRSIWTLAQRSYLINTLFEGKPIPAIYIRHSIDLEKGKSIKEIVDGQQRVKSIIGFYQNEFSAKTANSKLRVKFEDLTPAQRQKFLLTAIPVGFLLGATESDVIDIFGRINSVAKTLNPQEKRNAAFSGEMKQFCLQESSKRLSFWRGYKIFTANDIARMSEVHFVSDLVYNLLNGLSDYSSKSIDDLYKKYDEEFPNQNDICERLDRVFDFFISLQPELICETIFNRPPLFFSLFLVLDSIKNLSHRTVEQGIRRMDTVFSEPKYQDQRDLDFQTACSASTQRIKQRKIRAQYICHYLRHVPPKD